MLFHAIPLHPGNVTMAPFREALHAVPCWEQVGDGITSLLCAAAWPQRGCLVGHQMFGSLWTHAGCCCGGCPNAAWLLGRLLDVGGSTNPCTLLLQWLPYAGWAFLANCLGFGSKRSSMTCRTAAEWLWPPSSVIRRAPELIHAAAAAVQLPVERWLWLAQAHAMLVLHCTAHQAPEHHHADGLASQPPRVAQYVAQYDKRQAQTNCREGFRRPIWSCLGQQQCCSPLGVCMRS